MIIFTLAGADPDHHIYTNRADPDHHIYTGRGGSRQSYLYRQGWIQMIIFTPVQFTPADILFLKTQTAFETLLFSRPTAASFQNSELASIICSCRQPISRSRINGRRGNAIASPTLCAVPVLGSTPCAIVIPIQIVVEQQKVHCSACVYNRE